MEIHGCWLLAVVLGPFAGLDVAARCETGAIVPIDLHFSDFALPRGRLNAGRVASSEAVRLQCDVCVAEVRKNLQLFSLSGGEVSLR